MCVPGEEPSRPAAEQCRSHVPVPLFVTSLVCEPIPDLSPCFSLSSLPSSALALMVGSSSGLLCLAHLFSPICFPQGLPSQGLVLSDSSPARVAGLSFLSPTWSLGNSLVVLQGQPWMRSWSSCRDGAAGHPDGHLMGIQAGLPQGLSTGQLGLAFRVLVLGR